MPRSCRCAYCSERLEPAQELRFLVETANLDNPTYLDHIRRLPAKANGKPIPVCKGCQAKVEASPRRVLPVPVSPVRTGVLAAVGLLSVGWLLHNLLLGPKTV